jgi:hypothetical protein
MPPLKKGPHILAVLYKLAELEERFGPELCVAEIGVLRGDLTSQILSWFPRSRVWAIDPWEPYSTGSTYTAQDARRPAKAWNRDKRTVRDRVKKYGEGRCMLMQMGSDQACRYLKRTQQSLHLVFIDGLHTEEQVHRDIYNYYPLLVPGGTMGGHDLTERAPGVEEALHAHARPFETGIAETWWYEPKRDGQT